MMSNTYRNARRDAVEASTEHRSTEPTEAQIKAAEGAMDYWFECTSEDDNQYCSPPRTRPASEEETTEAIRVMLKAAFDA